MNARAELDQLLPPARPTATSTALEEEAIFILREVAATFERPALLFSGGKDSCVVLRLRREGVQDARGTAATGPLPFPLLHVDTGHNFPEVIEFRDQRVAEMGERLVVAQPRRLDQARHGAPGASRSNRATATRP